MKRTDLVSALACLFMALTLAAAPAHANAKSKAKSKTAMPQKAAALLYADRSDAMRFADDLAERRGLPRDWVRSAIGSARQQTTAVRLMRPAPRGTAKNWQVYRSRFIDPVRIGAGVRFWRENAPTLERAEASYGVPAEIIVGIIGVETIYGRNVGNFRVIDVLSTLSFDFPPEHTRADARTAYFRGELEQFLSWQYRMGADPTLPLGSYAGAMGMPQFMPSSLVKFAVDFDGDGKIDLQGSPDDVIGSVANYFKGHGWRPGMPTHYPVRLTGSPDDLLDLMAPDILPSFSTDSFAAKGAMLEPNARQHLGPLALIELQNGPDAPQYVAGTENFYVITRYNWSSYYAMAVIELGREVKSALGR